jgi:hypothetical protein
MAVRNSIILSFLLFMILLHMKSSLSDGTYFQFYRYRFQLLLSWWLMLDPRSVGLSILKCKLELLLLVGVQ